MIQDGVPFTIPPHGTQGAQGKDHSESLDNNGPGDILHGGDHDEPDQGGGGDHLLLPWSLPWQ